VSKKLFAATALEVPWLTWKFGANVGTAVRGIGGPDLEVVVPDPVGVSTPTDPQVVPGV
jgi:hypothetical protein